LLRNLIFPAMTLAVSSAVLGDAADTLAETAGDERIDEMVVVGTKQVYAVSQVSRDMIARQAVVTSVNDVLNELPGVIVAEGDYFGASDWMTSISMRGFNSGPGGQQIGTTIDGLPNGGSSYGGGSRANRYMDVLELETVEVSQGTADISSRSNEALGGTLDFVTRNPLDEKNVRLMAAAGDQNARKYYARVDTGEFAPDTRAFISASSSRINDWIDNEATVERDYVMAKVTSEYAGYDLSGLVTYNDASEHEFETVSLDDYYSNPRGDALHMEWTGIPEIDQYYRDGWRALRENTFTYLRAERDFGAFDFQATGYLHRMKGRGDWLPPYLVDVTDEGAGNPESEFLGGSTHYGPGINEDFYFVNPDGSKAEMIDGCVPTAGLDAEKDPDCYPANALPVMSYRHSHYKNRRTGLTVDASYTFNIGYLENTLRGGFWYEDGKSSVTRDWHKVIDTRIGPAFDHTPYWVQYHDDYTTEETMYYLEDVISFGGPLTARVGVKQFNIDTTYDEPIGSDPHSELSSESDPLISAGFSYQTPVEGLELFAGYSENFAAISKDRVAGSTSEELSQIEPETAENVEFGLRFDYGRFRAAATIYDISFENRIVFVEDGAVTGIDYLSQVDGAYVNLGGIDSSGFELLGSYALDSGWRISGSYTYNDATYVGSGSEALDEEAEVVPGARVWGTPKTQYAIAADYSGEVLEAGISLRHVGDRYIDFENTQIAPSYNVSDAYIGVNLYNVAPQVQGLNARLNINNLFDREFINGIYSGGSVFPAPPRTVTFSVTADF